MIYKASGVLALVCAVATAISAYSAPAAAQTAAQLQLLQACGGNLVACANVARQAQALQALGGSAGGAGALNVASQQYGQCVQNAGQNAQAAQACMRLLPPEWAAMAGQAQQAYLNNPAAANTAVSQVMANAQAMAAGQPERASPLQQNNPYGAAIAGIAGQAVGRMSPGAQANAAATQAAYVGCIQAAGLNIAAAQACAQPVQQAYGGFAGVPAPAPQPGYNPVNNANAVVAAAGSYQACVMAVGATNAAGVQSCQRQYLGVGGGAPASPMFGGKPATTPAAAPYNPFAAMAGQ